MKIRNSERGQAIAEYMPLIPPVLLLSIVILIPIASRMEYIFCRMVNTLEPDKCAALELPPEEATPEPEEEDLCTPLQEEKGGSQCEQDPNCSHLPGVNSGYYKSTKDVQTFVIKAGTGYHRYYAGHTNDGCYDVNIDGGTVEWSRVGKGKNCKDISHEQAWRTLICQ